MNWFIQISNGHINSNIDYGFPKTQSVCFHIDGYVVPRVSVHEKYKNLNQSELLIRLFDEYGYDFIKYIKGIFTIILYSNNEWHIYSDIHCIRKYYTYTNENDLLISNSLNYISDKYNLEIDVENAAIFSLISHFINGETAFKNVETQMPAEVLSIVNCKIQRSYYWHPKNLFKIGITKKQPISFYAQQWKQIINSYVNFIHPKGISVTLTGGNDSRMVLSALIHNINILHAFTFGDPKSLDCIIATKIKNEINLDYSNHYVNPITTEWFSCQARKIMDFGNSLINIHRAHRNDAIENEKKDHPQNEMLFTGLLGGEYFKEPSYNDTVIPTLFKIMDLKSEKKAKKFILELLSSTGFRIELLNIDRLYTLLKKNQKNTIGLNKKQQKFVYTFLFYGCTHHTQDSNVFSKHFKYVVNPFMDIDFMEMIKQYPSWYVNKKNNILSKIYHSDFFVGITDQLAPELSQIPYAKRGEYTADELLRNKIKYLFNRIYSIIKKDNHVYPYNFPMGYWLFHFCENELQNRSEIIAKLFNIKLLNSKTKEFKNKKAEQNWHVVTNPINLAMIYDKFKQK